MGTITRSFANNITTSGVLLPASLNNNSIANVTAYNVAIATGNMVLISSQTASASASISFTTGIDSTYKEYQFWFINMHPSATSYLSFNLSTDGGSNYNVTKTSSYINAYHNESGADYALAFSDGQALEQSTAFQEIASLKTGNTCNGSGTLILFNPASTSYTKHFLFDMSNNNYGGANYCEHYLGAGYGNTTSAVNAIQFKNSTGNIDEGTILMFGIK
jgi:hypothetical protein